MEPSTDRILLVEDDETIRNELVDTLHDSGFSVSPAASYAEAERMLEERFDLVLLDLWLPDRDGLELCERLRLGGNTIPIVVLTSRDAPGEVVRGLNAGADDYIVKPFEVPELIARVQSVLRRSSGAQKGGPISIGPIEINTMTRRAWKHGEEIELTRREFDLLAFFMRYPGQAWTRNQLLKRVWGEDYGGDNRTVDLHVARLRAMIEENPRDPYWIETLWRVGYRYREEDE